MEGFREIRLESLSGAVAQWKRASLAGKRPRVQIPSAPPIILVLKG